MNARARLEPLDIVYAQKTLLLFPGLSSAARTIGGAILDHFNKRTARCDPGIDRLGKANCRCQRGYLHDPFFYRHWRDRGQQRKEYVPREKVAETLVDIALRKAELLPLSHVKTQLKQLIQGDGL